jgi:hypothetical protein
MFCVGVFGRSVTSVAMRMRLRTVYFVNKCNAFYTSSVISKGNVAINSITVLSTKRKRFILVKFDVSNYAGSLMIMEIMVALFELLYTCPQLL